MASMSLPTERYALLLRQMGEEIGNVRGWKKRVAEALGVHPSYVSRILSGEKLTIGPDVLDRACERLRLDPRFFFTELPEPPRYRDYLEAAVQAQAEREGRQQADDSWRSWNEAGEAAMRFVRANKLSDADTVAAAQELLRAARALPVVQYTLSLARAAESNDAEAMASEAWKLSGELLSERIIRGG